jgi:hypothetical protein
MSTFDPLSRLLRISEAQHGVIISRQARECGISARTMHRLVVEGWFRIVRPRAFAAAGLPPSPWEDAIAVGLLAGPGVVLSHRTAGAIHRVPGLAAPELPEVTVPSTRHPRTPGAVVHRVGRLDACDIQTRQPVAVTTPARTLVDLAGQLDAPLLERILDEGSVNRLWTTDDLIACAARLGSHGRSGRAALAKLLEARVGEPSVESPLELRMIRVLAPFAPFETQYQLVLDREVVILDIAWPAWRVGAEVDGWWVRSRSRSKFDRSQHRTNLLHAHRWRVAHLTSTMADATILTDVGRLLPPSVAARAGVG